MKIETKEYIKKHKKIYILMYISMAVFSTYILFPKSDLNIDEYEKFKIEGVFDIKVGSRGAAYFYINDVKFVCTNSSKFFEGRCTSNHALIYHKNQLVEAIYIKANYGSFKILSLKIKDSNIILYDSGKGSKYNANIFSLASILLLYLLLLVDFIIRVQKGLPK